MVCLTATIVGAIAIGVIFFELINEQWDNLIYHGSLGIFATVFFWLLCIVLGDQISFGIFIVPAVIFLTFILASYLLTKSIKDRGCCLKCRDTPQPSPEPTPNPDPNGENCEPIRLNATPVLPS